MMEISIVKKVVIGVCLGLLALTVMCFSIGFSMVLIHTFNILGGILIDKIDLFFGVN
jgi:uncharacterized membrane protein